MVCPTSWDDLARGLRPAPLLDDDDPTTPKHGWQYMASQPVNAHFLGATVRPRLPDASQALLRSQSGPLASAPFICCPTARHTTLDAQVFRTLLLRRLWPSSSRVCRCGRPLDSSGHHRACAVAGVLGSRGFAWSPPQHECVAKEVDGSRPTSGSRT